ncbi:MAG: hypothetical protein M3H12_14060 [Chromatiales bacterium]|nr:hypothetical protein [Gammaproteobacteria bacterium]
MKYTILRPGICSIRYRVCLLAAVLLLVITGCASFTPQPIEEVPFRERAVTIEDGKVRVTAAVPSREESTALFGVDVAGKGIQPVWLRIENNDDSDYVFLPIGLDPDYFSPNEAAWKSRFFVCPAKQANPAH